MRRLIIAALLSVSVIAGCSKPAHDPAKWYLAEYKNEKFLIQHDHKLYTAKCVQSSWDEKDTADPTDCSGMLEVPGIGHEIPLGSDKELKGWHAYGGEAVFIPTDKHGAQYVLKFVSIKENGQ